jgi:hypothetical protein
MSLQIINIKHIIQTNFFNKETKFLTPPRQRKK